MHRALILTDQLRSYLRPWLEAANLAGCRLVVALTGVLATSGSYTASAQEAANQSITIGGFSLARCHDDFGGYCGKIQRPLDSSNEVPGTINIGFEFYPRTDHGSPTQGTILVQEGGPGYSSTGTREGYLRLFGALRNSRDLLIVDKRGTGLSGPIDCRPLQDDSGLSAASIAACFKQLGEAASLYSTAAAVDDIAAVLDALAITQVDLYGDSYGSYVGQVFAVRHPGRLRSLVLDSTFPARGMTPWYETEWASGWRGIDLACQRSPSCRDVGGRATARLTAFLNTIRQNPLTGEAPDGDGTVSTITLDAPTLFMMINAAGGGPTLYRELDAAVRAYVAFGDKMPLLRLTAEQITANSLGGAEVGDFSLGLFVAVACSDYPVAFDRAAAPNERRHQVGATVAAMRSARPNLYAPFTYGEVEASPLNLERLTMCAEWAPSRPVTEAVPADASFPPVPTLILSGDLDSITSPEEGLAAALQFPAATFVAVRNLTHITAMSTQAVYVPPVGADFTGCVGPLITRFVDTLAADDTSCAQQVRPIRTVPAFAERVEQVAPALAVQGNIGSEAALKIASVAAETVGDVLARQFVNYGGSGVGLRGGSFTIAQTATGHDFQLQAVRWTLDVEVSGTVSWDQSTGEIRADLEVKGPGDASGPLSLSWNDRQTDAVARITGTLGGESVEAERLAP
jgi:pimeloyl-ACP methyl ester carboxylesterase